MQPAAASIQISQAWVTVSNDSSAKPVWTRYCAVAGPLNVRSVYNSWRRRSISLLPLHEAAPGPSALAGCPDSNDDIRATDLHGGALAASIATRHRELIE